MHKGLTPQPPQIPQPILLPIVPVVRYINTSISSNHSNNNNNKASNSTNSIISTSISKTSTRSISINNQVVIHKKEKSGYQLHGNADDDEDLRTFDLNDHNYRFKFGTDMPSTVDLKAAIESCDVLCRFALHYTNQVNAVHDDGRGSSALDPEMRANLQKIRSMNMTMLLGLQNINKTNEKSGQAEESERFSQQDREERETSPLRFGPGPPPHDMVHELAKVATSIFQLAIRIKAWVGMTPEERELDEDINTIRGKRCLLMDSTLAASTVDQNGNVQKDWTIVPAASSISKSFYERQRELEQQRAANSSTSGPKQGHQPQVQSKHDPPHPGSSDRDRSRASVDQDGSSIRRTSSSSSLMSLSMQHTHNPNVTIPSSYSPDSALSGSMFDQGNLNGQRRIEGESRTPKDSDVPYQKYRKRAKRTQPPGRYYAKLLKRQGEQAQGPTNIKSRVAAARAQLQGITFPLRRRNGSQATEESAHESGSTTEAVIETKSEPISDSVPGSVSGSGTSSELPENSSLQPSSTQPTVPAPLEPLNREQE
ncbi:hypothetical protein BGX31_000192 [Mortierella sp. GBA43]|nr:hypothetical protein BGX31_000192 [Mortierella sp. GBA43]